MLILHSDHNLDFIIGGLKVEVTLLWARSLIEVFPDSDSCIYVNNGIHQDSDGNLITASWYCFYSILFTSNNFFRIYHDRHWYIKEHICVFSNFKSVTGWSGLTLNTLWDFQSCKNIVILFFGKNSMIQTRYAQVSRALSNRVISWYEVHLGPC